MTPVQVCPRFPPQSEGKPADRLGPDRAGSPRCPTTGAGAVACTGVILRELPVPAVPAARERRPELVGRGPGLNQPGQAAASVNLRLTDQVRHVRLDGAG